MRRLGHVMWWIALLLALGCGGNGANGAPGTPGEAGATPIGNIAGTVTSTVSSKLLDNVAVLGEPGDIKATTAADGTFNFVNLPAGAYTLTFTRDGYLPKTVPGVGVSPIGTTNLGVTLDTDASTDGPTIVVQDNLLAGFSTLVTVTATVTDTDSPSLTYAWSLVSGSPVTFTGGNTTAISFTTLALTAAKSYATYDAGAYSVARFGPMGFSPDETGNYVFQLTVTDPDGHTASAQAKVMATSPGPSLDNVAVGLPVWFQGDSLMADGGVMTTWSWTLDTSKVAGSTATLSNATTQFPSFTPDKIGTYGLTETISGKSLSVYTGNWRGISGGAPGSGDDYVVQGCPSCHNGPTTIPYAGTPNPPPDMFTPWRSTKHASAFSDGIDGLNGPDFGPECLQCHTLGDSPLASNAGFDDIATKDGWTFPTKLQSGNWNNLVTNQPDLAQLGNVQCESCHGPQTTPAHPTDVQARVSFSVEVCAQCHQDNPILYKVQQWQSSRHSNMHVAIKEGSEEQSPGVTHCPRCHTAQGFAQYAQQLNEGYNGYLTTDGLPYNDAGTNDAGSGATVATNLNLFAATVQPQVCASCHDPHNAAGNPGQLRIYGSIASLPNGQSNITGVGAGAVCMGCHNQRNGALGVNSSSPTFPTPHDGPQTDVMFGVNAFFVSASEASPHLAVKDTCVGCHYAIPTAAQAAAGQTTNHAFKTDLTICNNCHGSPDGGPGQVDGVGLQSGVQTQMLTLDKLIFAKIADTLANLVKTSTYVVGAQDTVTLNYLCAGAGTGTPTYTFNVAPIPANMEEQQPVSEWRALTTLWWWFPTLSGTSECTSAGALATGTYNGTNPLKISVSGIKSGGAAVFTLANTAIIVESIWNEALLHNDQTWGIHNFPFYQDVINATSTQLNTLP